MNKIYETEQFKISEQVVDLMDTPDVARMLLIEFDNGKSIQMDFVYGKLTQLKQLTNEKNSSS